MRSDAEIESAKASGSSSEEDDGDEGSVPSAEVFAVPQETLAADETALKVTGSIIIEGYEAGVIQMDVTPAKDGPTQPLTVARFNAPGPYTLYLPASTKKVRLSAILDLDSDGPTAKDPKGDYEDNPLEVDGEDASGVDIVIDLSNVPEPPPEPGQGEGDKMQEENAAGQGEGDKAAEEGEEKGAEGGEAKAADGAAEPEAPAPKAPAPEAEEAKAATPPPPPPLQSPDSAPEVEVAVPEAEEEKAADVGEEEVPAVLQEDND